MRRRVFLASVFQLILPLEILHLTIHTFELGDDSTQLFAAIDEAGDGDERMGLASSHKCADEQGDQDLDIRCAQGNSQRWR